MAGWMQDHKSWYADQTTGSYLPIDMVHGWEPLRMQMDSNVGPLIHMHICACSLHRPPCLLNTTERVSQVTNGFEILPAMDGGTSLQKIEHA